MNKSLGDIFVEAHRAANAPLDAELRQLQAELHELRHQLAEAQAASTTHQALSFVYRRLEGEFGRRKWWPDVAQAFNLAGQVALYGRTESEMLEAGK